MKVIAGVDNAGIVSSEVVVVVIIIRKRTDTRIRMEAFETGRVLKQRWSSWHIESAGNIIISGCIVVVVVGVEESESRVSWLLVRGLKACWGERRGSWGEGMGGAEAVAQGWEVLEAVAVVVVVVAVVAGGGGGAGIWGGDWERE